MRWLAVVAVLAAACGTYTFQHGPDDQDELVGCPPCALPEVCDESRHVCSTAQLIWEELDGSATGDGVSGAGAEDLALAVTADGNPVVAWVDNGEVFARRWNGSHWQDLGSGVSLTSGPSQEISISADADDRVLLAWSEGIDAAREIFARRWDGNAWLELAGSASGGGMSKTTGAQSMQPQTAISAGGEPVIAWLENTGPTGWEIYARRFDGSAWRDFGDSASSDGVSKSGATAWNPSLALRNDGSPCVAWSDGDTTSDMRVRCWNGVAWLALGPSADPGGISSTSAYAYNSWLAVDSLGRPWLAWRGNDTGAWEAYLRYFDAGAWHELGGSPRVSGDIAASDHADMALASSDRPVVAWIQDVGGGRAVSASYWSGVQWSSLTPGGNEISTAGAVDALRVAVANSGPVLIAWLQDGHVYLKRLR